MLSETFFTSILARPKTANTAVAKDVGIYLRELQPNPAVRATFKKSSTNTNSLSATATHIFAGQAEKAVVHVYSRERGNQEALISFPERINSLTCYGETVVVLGTAEGRIILWEVCTGRQIVTPAAHLQAVSCLATTQSHLLSGSEDSNILIWSMPQLLALGSDESPAPIRTLSDHRAAITSIAIGHSATTSNICVSTSKDNTVIVWSYSTGDALRTFLLPSAPLCVALDPCDRAVYVGFEDGSLQLIEFLDAKAVLHPIYNSELQNTPVQITSPSWIAPSELGSVHCLGLSYDGTCVLSGHSSGKIAQWDTGRRAFGAEIADLNAPVTNIVLLSPFPPQVSVKAVTIVKPRIGEQTYTLNTQLSGSSASNPFNDTLASTGFPITYLEDSISRFARPAEGLLGSNDQLAEENRELWKIINEQRALQKRTWEKYTQLKSGG